MRRSLTSHRLKTLMEELARTAPRRRSYRVYIVGGGTAVLLGWRPSTVDADLYSDRDEVFREVQAIKERLRLNVELVRPEDFVPPLEGTAGRHVFIETIGAVSFYHYDPYAQVFSKIVRGFSKDLDDARCFVREGLVDPGRLRELVRSIPESAYAAYPSLSRGGVLGALDGFLSTQG